MHHKAKLGMVPPWGEATYARRGCVETLVSELKELGRIVRRRDYTG